MIRKLAVLGAAVAMPLALIIPSSQAASVTSDNSNSTVTCNTINKGTIKLKPPLTNVDQGPAVIQVKGKLAGCSTDAVDSNSDPVTLTDLKSSFKGTINAPTSDCAGLLGPSTASGSVTIKWKADNGVKLDEKSSTVTIPSGGVTTGLYASPFGAAYGAFSLGTSSFASGSPGTALSVTGGFTGGDGGASSVANTVTNEDVAFILGQCGAKGVKALTIGIGQISLG